MNELTLMLHVFFGVLSVVGSVWVFVDTLSVTGANVDRIRRMSCVIALLMWAGYCFAGYWYVTYYAADKAVILKGPFPIAHSFFMETKEHMVIMLLLLATYLPIAAANDLVQNRAARKLVLWVSALVALTALSAEGLGGIIAMGVKLGLEAK